jgi:hypothetical protein
MTIKKNLRIKRTDKNIEVTADGDEWMLSVGEKGACLLKPVKGVDDDGNEVDGWMEAELVDALERDDKAFIDAFYAAHYPELMNTPFEELEKKLKG